MTWVNIETAISNQGFDIVEELLFGLIMAVKCSPNVPNSHFAYAESVREKLNRQQLTGWRDDFARLAYILHEIATMPDEERIID